MVKTYKSKDEIPKTFRANDNKLYYFYRTVSEDADKTYLKNLQNKVSAMGDSIWLPIIIIRTEMWAIYTDKKQEK
jgi:hypothetical protein